MPTKKKYLIASVILLTSFFATTYLFGQGVARPFSPLVNDKGDIAFPQDFPNGYVHIGTVAVAGNGGVTDTHATYTRPADAAYYRANGSFPDGAVLIKDVQGVIGSPHTTGNAFWASEGKTWFLMIKDSVGRFPNNPLWGDGWGWSQYDPKDRSKQIAKNYKSDCIQCHVPAKSTDWVYVYAYPGLGEGIRKFTPAAAHAATAKAEAAPAPAAPASAASPAMIAAGKAAFEETCTACHTAEAGKNNTGPSLFGLVGRKVGTEPTYGYSQAMKDATVVWSQETLPKFLADPKGFIPGNRMGRFFQGVDSAEKREALASYLASVK